MSGMRSEAGSGSLYVLWLGAVLVAAGLALAAFTGALAARHTAESAADLGALAAAASASAGEVVACREAARIVAANGASLQTCRLVGGSVAEVVAAVGLGSRAGEGAGAGGRTGAGLSRVLPPATARARAGPAAEP
jgi:secretion/DNA translocation related TadE-like protein